MFIYVLYFHASLVITSNNTFLEVHTQQQTKLTEIFEVDVVIWSPDHLNLFHLLPGEILLLLRIILVYCDVTIPTECDVTAGHFAALMHNWVVGVYVLEKHIKGWLFVHNLIVIIILWEVWLNYMFYIKIKIISMC